MATLKDIIAHANGTHRAVEPSDDYTALASSVADLTAMVTALSRDIAALKAQAPVSVSTVGPIPATPGDISSGRAGMRYIALKLGGKTNEDSIRKALTNSPAFADLREKAPDLTTNVPIMRWLAGEYDGRLRFAWIASGAATAAELVTGARA